MINLNLSVNALPVVEIEEMNGTISANNSFESFQWYFNNEILNNETSASISPNENGDYYLEVTNENGCIGSSNVVNFINTSIETTNLSGLNIYPNPTTGELIIDLDNALFEAEMFDVYGKRVRTDMSLKNDISNLENGIYFLIIQREENTAVFKVLKQD